MEPAYFIREIYYLSKNEMENMIQLHTWSNGQLSSSNKGRRSYIIKRWWRYAIKSVIRLNRAKKGQFYGIYLSDKDYEISYKKKYIEHYKVIESITEKDKDYYTAL